MITPQQVSKVFKVTYPLESFALHQGFGENIVGFYKDLGMRGHNGLDLVAKDGTPCYAVCDGKVEFYADKDGGLGANLYSKEFKVDEELYRLKFIYYHLKQFIVDPDGQVSKGQMIALTDNTGRYTTGAHLHFGMKIQLLKGFVWTQDMNNGYYGAQDPAPLFDDDILLLPVDRRYGETRNWIAEFLTRFKKQEVHQEFLKYGRSPSSITDRENNALVYGGWAVKDVVNTALWVTWTQRKK